MWTKAIPALAVRLSYRQQKRGRTRSWSSMALPTQMQSSHLWFSGHCPRQLFSPPPCALNIKAMSGITTFYSQHIHPKQRHRVAVLCQDFLSCLPSLRTLTKSYAGIQTCGNIITLFKHCYEKQNKTKQELTISTCVLSSSSMCSILNLSVTCGLSASSAAIFLFATDN